MNVLLIPLKKHSTRIIRKNFAEVGGKSLMAWALESAKLWPIPLQTVVATEDEEIKKIARSFGAKIFDLTEEDTKVSATEVWMKFAKETKETNIHITTQATSPFGRKSEIQNAWEMFLSGKYDIVQSVLKLRFGTFDSHGRPNRDLLIPSQDLQPHFYPTGNFFIAHSDYLRSLPNLKNFYDGRVGLAEVSLPSATDIDEPEDLETARFLAPLYS